MPRPPKLRWVAHVPGAVYFKPRGIPMMDLEEVVFDLDELEALRLVDFEALSQEEAGAKMGVSRGTIGRLLAPPRRIAQTRVRAACPWRNQAALT